MPVIDLGSVVGPQGPQGVAGQTGATGATGAAGPNQVTGSTSTTLNGILQGNGSAVSALASDSAPTKDSNNAIRSGAVYTALTKKVGKNLLRNWYFVGGGSQGGGIRFPLNTRAQTTYTNSVSSFCIDGWLFNAQTYGTLTLNANYITIAKNAAESDVIFSQNLNMDLNGEVVTVSIITSDGLVTKTSGILSSGTTSTWQLSYTTDWGWCGVRCLQGAASKYWEFRITVPDSVNLVAVKLETGPIQTLGYYSGGIWHVNEIPALPEEMFRVQTARIDTSDSYGFHFPAYADMIAPAERGTKASQRYTTGKLFVWNGLLYKATTTIEANTDFTPPTNCVVTSIAAELNL